VVVIPEGRGGVTLGEDLEGDDGGGALRGAGGAQQADQRGERPARRDPRRGPGCLAGVGVGKVGGGGVPGRGVSRAGPSHGGNPCFHAGWQWHSQGITATVPHLAAAGTGCRRWAGITCEDRRVAGGWWARGPPGTRRSTSSTARAPRQSAALAATASASPTGPNGSGGGRSQKRQRRRRGGKLRINPGWRIYTLNDKSVVALRCDEPWPK